MKSKKKVNLTTLKSQIIRIIWSITWATGTIFLPRSIGDGWKRFLLRCFGAQISDSARIYSSVKIFYPPHLIMDDYSCLASEVECYNVDIIRLGKHSTVSQGSYLCTASHDITKKAHPLITAPITIEDNAWVGAKAFIGMGVTIGVGAVVGATASVYKDVKAWTVVGGNPAKYIKNRIIKDA